MAQRGEQQNKHSVSFLLNQEEEELKKQETTATVILPPDPDHPLEGAKEPQGSGTTLFEYSAPFASLDPFFVDLREQFAAATAGLDLLANSVMMTISPSSGDPLQPQANFLVRPSPGGGNVARRRFAAHEKDLLDWHSFTRIPAPTSPCASTSPSCCRSNQRLCTSGKMREEVFLGFPSNSHRCSLIGFKTEDAGRKSAQVLLTNEACRYFILK